MLATITFLSCLELIGLVVLAVLLVAAFVYWISHGGFIGWWMANDVMRLLGAVLSAIGEAIMGILRRD